MLKMGSVFASVAITLPSHEERRRFGAPATQYVRPFLWISPVSIVVADVSSQFPTSQLCNMIVLVGRFRGTLFGRQIVLSMHEKVNKENSSGAKVD